VCVYSGIQIFNNLPLEIKIVANNQKNNFKLALKIICIHLYFLYNGRVCYWFGNCVPYYKIHYYSGTLIYDSVYGHSVSTHGLFLSFCLSTLCTYSLILYSELITFLCINLIWLIYCIVITNYYYMYYCSDSFCIVYVVIYWQVLHTLWWIAGILNKWLWLWLCSRR